MQCLMRIKIKLALHASQNKPFIDCKSPKRRACLARVVCLDFNAGSLKMTRFARWRKTYNTSSKEETESSISEPYTQYGAFGKQVQSQFICPSRVLRFRLESLLEVSSAWSFSEELPRWI